MDNEPSPEKQLSPEKQPSSGDDTFVFKRTQVYAVLLPVAFVLGLAVGFIFWGRGARPAAATQAAAVTEVAGQQEQAVKRYDVPVDDDPSIGPDNAPITLIEFSDYQCPYCRRWHTEVFNKIRQDYPTQVRIVYRDFPLGSMHPDATPAAEAAGCANEQGAFWAFNDKLFSGSELGEDIYIQYATELGLNIQQFKACIQSGKYSDEVQKDVQFATNLGVRSTPTFFLNGLPIVGAQPYDVFKQVIDQELAGEIPK
jgi:protein-disulfide isomerase